MSDVQIHALQCGGDLMDWGLFDPLDERRGQAVYNPYFAYVVRHPAGTVLFDSGAHPDLAVDPVSRMGPSAADYEFRLAEDDRMEAVLAQIGLTPPDIDLVIQSHLHFDHAGGLYAFPETPVMIQRAELEYAQDTTHDQSEIYVKDDFAMVSDWRLADGDEDVFGDGRLTVISTPGHTRGHQSLLVHLDSGQTIFLLADAAYLLEKLRARRPPGLLWDESAILATWDRIEQLEREHDAFLIACHDLDFRERIKLAPEAFYE